MVADGERSAQCRACLAVVHVTVGKEEGVLGREASTDVAGLSDEGVVELCAVHYGGTCLHDDVLADDVVAHIDSGVGCRCKGAVYEA